VITCLYVLNFSSPGIVVETVFCDTFCFSPVLALPGFQGLDTFAVNAIPGEPYFFYWLDAYSNTKLINDLFVALVGVRSLVLKCCFQSVFLVSQQAGVS
jgi:hypothetical protein